MTLAELADRITVHLRRFERDPKINPYKDTMPSCYYHPLAWRCGRYVQLKYVDYHSPDSLTRPMAERYLAWLNGGGVGKHWDMPPLKATWPEGKIT